MVTDEQVWLDALASNFGELGNFRGVYLFLLFCIRGNFVNFKCHLRVLPRLIRWVLHRCFICPFSATSRTAGQLLIIVWLCQWLAGLCVRHPGRKRSQGRHSDRNWWEWDEVRYVGHPLPGQLPCIYVCGCLSVFVARRLRPSPCLWRVQCR